MAVKKRSKERIGIVGRRIKGLRLDRNMSIEDLAKKTSVSSVTISNIEKGIYSPKLTTILEIAKALGTTIVHLVEDVDEPRVFRIDRDTQRLKSKDGIVIQDFSPVMRDKRVSVYMMEMEKGASTLEHDTFDGNEFIYVVSGRLTVTIEDSPYELGEGESLYFHGSYRHVIEAMEPSELLFLSIFSF